MKDVKTPLLLTSLLVATLAFDPLLSRMILAGTTGGAERFVLSKVKAKYQNIWIRPRIVPLGILFLDENHLWS
jgi:hypothetical protein